MRPKYNMQELVLFFHHMGLGALTQVIRTGSRGLGPLRHLASLTKLVLLLLMVVAAPYSQMVAISDLS